MQTLSGTWRLAADPENKGREERWFEKIQPGAEEAPVPGIIQQALPGYHGVAWYWRTFRTGRAVGADERCLLRFAAVDYMGDVWVNGRRVGGHEGGETPFEVDVTKAVRRGRQNLVAVRVLNPTNEPIDGVVLGQTPHDNRRMPHKFGAAFNIGGITGPVELVIVPAVRVADLFIRPELARGDVRISITVRNDADKAAKGKLLASVGPAMSGEVVTGSELTASIPSGESAHEMKLRVDDPHAWSLDDPFLYLATVRLEARAPKAKFRHEKSVRCGFRDFRVIDGYFHLNGKRIFLKSSHTGNHFPMGQVTPVDPDLMRRDLIMAKASGFNMIRWIAGMARPEQLDFCDEIGLMVYEEHLGSWQLEDSPDMARRYDLSTREMILRDRNHPSVTIWGMLNETRDGPVFRHAVQTLKLVRSLDDTRLVLLSSGRWDCDPSIGSVSNPGGDRWEHVWGAEAPRAPRPDSQWHPARAGYFEGAGDAHVYPPVPHGPQTIRFLRTLGRDTKPVFLSEYGIGSQINVIDEWRHYRQAGARDDLEDASLMRSMCRKFEKDWKRLGMEDVYPFPEEMLLESQRLHCRQRLLGFDAVRSNPRICGYNVTGLLDHGYTGEGLWTFFRRWKPGIADALSDGWAPLRWCLFVTPLHTYARRKIVVEAVLANEDVLQPGRYRVRLRVFGPEGNVWAKNLTVRVPRPAAGSMPPMAIPVYKGELRLVGPAGQYTFAAEMDRAAPAGGRLTFFLSDRTNLPTVKGEVTTWGISGRACRWLEQRGLACRPFGQSSAKRREVILVGDLTKMKTVPNQWQQLVACMARGSVAVFLSPTAFAQGKDSTYWMPLKKKGQCTRFFEWLYHHEWVAKRHPIFDGLPAPGVMDWDYYGEILSCYGFEGLNTPDDVAAASIGTGSWHHPGGYGSGLLVGAYDLGHGRFVLNTFAILENLDTNPAADRLLVNLIRYAREHARGPAAKLPPRFDKVRE